MAVLLPHALFRFSSLLLRIENPYTQWVWIANPDQRHVAEHPRGRGILGSSLLVKENTRGLLEPLKRENEDNDKMQLHINVENC